MRSVVLARCGIRATLLPRPMVLRRCSSGQGQQGLRRESILPVMIDAAQMNHLASLARLELTPEERETMTQDLSRVLGYFEQLREVDTDGVEEMQRPVTLVNVLRDDVPGEPFATSVIDGLAPETQDGFIRVPRTVEAE